MTFERSLTHNFGSVVIESSGKGSNYAMDIRRANNNVSFQVNATYVGTAAVLASSTDINDTTDTFTKTAHGYFTGTKGQFTTSSALPTGLSTSTNYYVIVVDANNFKVASSLANALAGTAIDITDVGTGNQTFTPTALSGVSYKLQFSNDYDVWVDINGAQQTSGNWFDAVSGESASAVTQNITATGTNAVSTWNSAYAYARIYFSVSAGSIKANVWGHC